MGRLAGFHTHFDTRLTNGTFDTRVSGTTKAPFKTWVSVVPLGSLQVTGQTQEISDSVLYWHVCLCVCMCVYVCVCYTHFLTPVSLRTRRARGL